MTLRWTALDDLDPAVRAALSGPGTPHEMVVEDVHGRPYDVFLQRDPNLRTLLERSAAFGDRPYLIFPDRTITYGEVVERVGAVAHHLAEEHGIGPGDRVAFAGANHLGYALGAWATICLGAAVVGLNGWWTATELAAGVDLTSPVLLVGDDRRLERLREGRVGTPAVGFDELVERSTKAGISLPDTQADEDDPALILFTSGTAGPPKAAVIPHRSMLMYGQSFVLSRMASLAAEAEPGPPSAAAPVMICSSPFFHISGAAPLIGVGPRGGTSLVIPAAGRFDPTAYLELTQAHHATSWGGVPTQLWRLLEHPDFDSFDLTSVASVSIGGSNVPQELVRLLDRKLPGVRLSVGYAMTECPAATVSLAGEALRSQGCVGSPVPGIAVQIRDESGLEVPDGEVGEINLRGALTFLGYWGDPEATAAAVDDDGWYRTGDFGCVEDGNLRIASRLRDLIIRGGENIYPAEVENRLLAHPVIDDAAVIGVDHRTLGQEVKAILVLRPGTTLAVEDVQSWVAQTLATFKVPAHVEFRTSLPYTETGKLLKRQLEAEGQLAG